MALNELHAVGVTEQFRERAEAVDPRFIQAGIMNARRFSWEVLHQLRGLLREGMTELEARRLALDVFRERGVKKHWHQPNIRFGPGSALTFHDPLQADYRLRAGDVIAMDLGPVWADPESGLEYEGDVGDSFVFEMNPSAPGEAVRLVETVRSLFREGQEMWTTQPGLSGRELYSRLALRAQEEGYRLLDNVVGHRAADFPHMKYSKDRLPDLDFHPSGGLWILELQIVHPTLPIGAFYEDLLVADTSD